MVLVYIHYYISMENEASSSEQKLDRMIELLEKIERHFNPPLWKKAGAFLFTHFITIVSLLALAYATWKIWGVVEGIQDNVAGMKGFLGTQLDKVKFW